VFAIAPLHLVLSAVALAVLWPARAADALTLSTGTFWEYRWDQRTTSSSSSGTSTSRDASRFRVTLGSPTVIEGKLAYAVSVGGLPPDGWFRWKFLVADGLKVLGSSDGQELVTLFDPTLASWTGDGFFESFAGAENLEPVTWQIGRIENDYVEVDAAETHTGSARDMCEWIGGQQFCYESSWDHDWYEYYHDAVGPLGSKHEWSTSYSGTYPSSHTGERHVGLVATSLLGDRLDYLLEEEPNSRSSAMVIGPGTVIGLAKDSDSDPDAVYVPGFDQPVEVHDWYRFQIPAGSQVRVDLEWTTAGGGRSDLDLVLVQPLGIPLGDQMKGYSLDDNVGTGVERESIQVGLSAMPHGIYLIGVSAFDTNHKRLEYVMTLVPEPDGLALQLAALGSLGIVALTRRCCSV
jgi:hypothetical protein